VFRLFCVKLKEENVDQCVDDFARNEHKKMWSRIRWMSRGVVGDVRRDGRKCYWVLVR